MPLVQKVVTCGRPYQAHVRETRGGVTRELPARDTHAWRMMLYAGQAR